MREIAVTASVLSADFSKLGESLKAAEKAGCDYIHLDVMDGTFVPNITIGQPVVKALDRVTPLPMDAHLMVDEPGRYVAEFALPNVEYIVVHPEACRHLDRVLQQIREAGKTPGVALNPATPACAAECVMEEVGMVLVMSVNPGFGGQKFIPYTLKKIEELRKVIDASGKDIWLGVDGGIDDATAPKVREAGGDFLISGSYLFGAKDGMASAVKKLKGK